MSKTTKILMGAGAVVVVVALIFLIKNQLDMLNKQSALDDQLVDMRQLQDGWVRSSARYVTKDDLEKLAREFDSDLDSIKKDLKDLGAEVKGLNVMVVSTPGYYGGDLPSTGTEPGGPGTTPGTVECPDGSVVPCPDSDPHGYMKNTQKLALSEPFSDKVSVPWGEAKFSAWRDRPWDLTVKPREYTVTTVVSQNEEGRHFVHNKFSILVDGKRYTAPNVQSQFVEVFPEPEFRFDPHLMLAMGAGTYVSPVGGELMPSVQLSLFSYGTTKVNPDVVMLGLGAGYGVSEKSVSAVITPAAYNVGKHLPLVNNLYVGPQVSVNPDNVGFLLGVGASL